MSMSYDIKKITDAGLQVVFEKNKDGCVARAVRTGKTIAKGECPSPVNNAAEAALGDLIAALIALSGPKAFSQDGMLAKVFS